MAMPDPRNTAAAAAAPAKLPELIDPNDYAAVRARMRRKAMEALTGSFPYANDRYAIHLKDVRLDDRDYSLKDQKKARMQNGTLSNKVTGVYEVHDVLTGRPISRTGRKTIISLPYLTNRGTYIRNGTEYVVSRQFRLAPSTYSHRTADGKVETQFNLKPGTGTSFRLYMEPETGIFYMRRNGRKTPLLPVLKAMGVQEDAIRKTWGEDIYKANLPAARSSYAVNWLRSFDDTRTDSEGIRSEAELDNDEDIQEDPAEVEVPDSDDSGLFGKEASDSYNEEAVRAKLLEEFGKGRLDPAATRLTSGIETDRVSPELMLHTTDRLIRLANNQAEEDDRDSLSYQTVHDVGDFISNKLQRDQQSVLRKMLWKITNRAGDASVIPTGLLTKHVDHLFTNSGLAFGIEEVNPHDMYDQNQRIIRLGEGGISCHSEDTEVLTDRGWLFWKDLTGDEQLATRNEKDSLIFVSPNKLIKDWYEGPMYQGMTDQVDYLVTPNHRMYVSLSDETSSSDYDFVEAEYLYGTKARHLASADGLYTEEAVVPGHMFGRSAHSIQSYRGFVYCADIGGGLLLTRRNGKALWSGNSMDSVPKSARNVQPSYLGLIDPVRAPESLAIGIDLRMARGTRMGDDNLLYRQVLNTKTGQMEWVNSRTLADSVYGFPEAMDPSLAVVPAMVRSRELTYLPREQVQYILPSGDDMFSTGANMVPLKSGVKGMRLLMGGKHSVSALPLVDREAPLVDTADPEYGDTFTRLGRHMSTARSPVTGTVTAVYKDHIDVQDAATGETKQVDIYDSFPLARKTFIRNTPVVKAGDKVKQDDLLAYSNYTDPSGRAALGRNFRVAYINWKGKNYADAVVISESAAKKLTSEHMYTEGLDLQGKKNLSTQKNRYSILYPGKYSSDQMKNLTDEGHIKVGSVVNYGDPLVLAVEDNPPSPKTLGRRIRSDKTVTWEHHMPGVVTDVARTAKGVQVAVRANAPMQVADKLTGRFGNKGVVAEIVKDSEMPQDSKGRAYDIIYSPLGIPSRTNPAQLAAVALGKVAAKTGKPYALEGFDSEEDYMEFALKELKKANLSDVDTVFDPTTGKDIKEVFNGVDYFYKLHQTAESKGKSRSQAGYTIDDQPSKGGDSGAKHLGCFIAKQVVQTLHGERQIGRICEKRQSEQVPCFDLENNRWTVRPITNWFTYDCPVDNILCIELAGVPATTGSVRTKHTSCMYPTKNHMVYKYDLTKVPAGDLVVGDVLNSWGVLPTEDQMQIMLGSLLGDAYLNDSFQVMHSCKQRNYITFKQTVLSGVFAQVSDIRSEGVDPQGVSHRRTLLTMSQAHVVSDLKKICYSTGMRKVTPEWVARLNGLGLCILFLDDGWMCNRSKRKGISNLQGGIATNSMSDEERDLVAGKVAEILGVPVPKAYSSGKEKPGMRLLYLSSEACHKIAELIARYIPAEAIPRSKRWLRNRVAKLQTAEPPAQLRQTSSLGRVPVVIRDIRKYKPRSEDISTVKVYDFTVADHHNYLAGGVMVSNSMESQALLSHGATAVLKDMKLVKGQANDDFWRQIRSGGTPKMPGTPLVYEKFKDFIRASGVYLKETPEGDNIFAMTGKQAKELSGGREIRNANTFSATSGRPIPGGLFDPEATGSELNGDRWSEIRLPYKMPNPIMEDSLRSILKMTKKDYAEATRDPDALEERLRKINLDREMASAMSEIKGSSGPKRDAAVKRWGFLNGMKKNEVQPADFMMDVIPVLPPRFRPIQVSDITLVADPNKLYKAVLEGVEDYRDAVQVGVPKSVLDELRTGMYDNYKALVGTGDPAQPMLKEQGVEGILSQMFGKGSPKHGFYQRKVLGTNMDMTGLAVATPNAALRLGQVGLPEEYAWDLYEPFIIRHMVRSGVPATVASKAVEKRTPQAYASLQSVVKDRPVILNRAPTLHKFSMIALEPVLTKGKTIQAAPMLVTPLNLDYDGDIVSLSVPVSDDAVKEAREKMSPSANLIQASKEAPTYDIKEEMLHGLYFATRDPKDPTKPIVFETKQEAIEAYRKGLIKMDTPIQIKESGK